MFNDTSSPLRERCQWWSRVARSLLVIHSGAALAVADLERQELKFGFINLTDCAPLLGPEFIIDLPRPRSRRALLDHPDDYRQRTLELAVDAPGTIDDGALRVSANTVEMWYSVRALWPRNPPL